MKILTLISFFLLCSTLSLSQKIIIGVENLPSEKAILYSLSGEIQTFLDSLSARSKGLLQFNFSQQHPGFYLVSFENHKRIDFIYDNEDIEITTDADNILDSLKILKSESNRIYYEFVKLNKEYKIRTEMLQLVLANYPQHDNYYQTTKEKLAQVQEEYLYFVNVNSQSIPNSYVARYVKSAQLPVVDAEILSDEQLLYLKTHSLDNVNFYDDGLIYSDAFTNKTIEYLTYYRNPQLPLELLEKEFMSAVDTILSKAKVNEIVYTHIVEYLLDGFKKFGFDNVINYIIDNYVIKDDLCLDQKLTSALDRRIQQSKNFKLGNTVPNIVLPDSSGSEIELNKIQTSQILIIFYASWCPHCQTLLPQIYNLYKNQKEKKVEVFAISIDTTRTDWLNFIRNNNLNWLNVSDLNGWDGESASEYYLYATPTMFLINKEKKILLSSPSLNEFSDLFKD
jgi:peroxiredoxin